MDDAEFEATVTGKWSPGDENNTKYHMCVADDHCRYRSDACKKIHGDAELAFRFVQALERRLGSREAMWEQINLYSFTQPRLLSLVTPPQDPEFFPYWKHIVEYRKARVSFNGQQHQQNQLSPQQRKPYHQYQNRNNNKTSTATSTNAALNAIATQKPGMQQQQQQQQKQQQQQQRANDEYTMVVSKQEQRKLRQERRDARRAGASAVAAEALEAFKAAAIVETPNPTTPTPAAAVAAPVSTTAPTPTLRPMVGAKIAPKPAAASVAASPKPSPKIDAFTRADTVFVPMSKERYAAYMALMGATE